MSGVTRRGFLGAAAAVSGSSVVRAQAATQPGAFLRTPYLQSVGANQATVMWTMPTEHQARVVVTDPLGKSRSYDAVASKFEPSLTGLDAAYFQYQVTLTGLERATRYQYRVEASGVPVASPLSRLHEFRTEAPGKFRFLHFADAGEGSAEQLAVSRQMHTKDVDLVLANGDLAYDLATHASIESNYYSVYRELMSQVPFFATLGNHEYYTDGANPSVSGRVHPVAGVPYEGWGRYYSFDWANAHFVALDTNWPLERAAGGTGPMLNWLEQDLANTRKFWRIAFFHHPGYATGKHAASAEAARVRDHVVPILEKYGVQLVLNGHEHTYQRTYELRGGSPVAPNSGGIVHVTSGGGGAQAHYFEPDERVAKSLGVNHFLHSEVAGAALQIKAHAVDGAEIDALTLQPKPQIGSVVNSASFTPDLAGGSAVTIFGRNLFPEPASGGVLEANGCSVRVNGDPVPVQFADAMQVNIALPSATSGDVTFEVRTPNGSATTTLRLRAIAPALFSSPSEPGTALATSHGALITSETPVVAGQVVSLYATGLRAGEAVHLRLGGIEVPAAAVPTSFAGVWEVTAPLPGHPGSENLAVRISSGGVLSNELRLPVA